MILAAIQAFGYRVPVPGPVQGPEIALLGCLALALPIIVLRWRLGAADRAGPPGIIADITTWCVGAATGWVAAGLAATIALNAAAPAWWSLLAAAAGALIAALIALAVGRRTPTPAPTA